MKKSFLIFLFFAVTLTAFIACGGGSRPDVHIQEREIYPEFQWGDEIVIHDVWVTKSLSSVSEDTSFFEMEDGAFISIFKLAQGIAPVRFFSNNVSIRDGKKFGIKEISFSSPKVPSYGDEFPTSLDDPECFWLYDTRITAWVLTKELVENDEYFFLTIAIYGSKTAINHEYILWIKAMKTK